MERCLASDVNCFEWCNTFINKARFEAPLVCNLLNIRICFVFNFFIRPGFEFLS